MTRIPEDFRRVLENQIDNILKRHLSSITPLASWLFRKVFDAELISVQGAEIHKHNDYRRVAADPLAYGETDIEVIAMLNSFTLGKFRAGLLIENKVDANQMEKQGLRYSARGLYRKTAGDWDDFRCVLLFIFTLTANICATTS